MKIIELQPKTISVLIFCVVVMLMHVPFSAGAGNSITHVRSSNSVIVVDQNGTGDYSDLEDAMAVVNDGDTIILYPGKYEPLILNVNRSISLLAIDYENTMIYSYGAYIGAHGCHLRGIKFFINDDIGIEIRSDRNLIENCRVTSCERGIYVSGDYNRILNNTVFESQYGIAMFGAYHNIIKNNTVGNSYNYISGWTLSAGIDVWGSSNNVFEDNYVYNYSKYGIYVHGEQNILRNNTCWSDHSNTTGIYAHTRDNTVENNNASIKYGEPPPWFGGHSTEVCCGVCCLLPITILLMVTAVTAIVLKIRYGRKKKQGEQVEWLY